MVHHRGKPAGTLLAGSVLGLVLGATLLPASADEPPPQSAPPVHVVLRNHRFFPPQIILPPQQEHVIDIANHDNRPEHVVMRQLAINEVIPPGGHATIRIPPLEVGRYDFFGQAHPNTAQGVVILSRDE